MVIGKLLRRLTGKKPLPEREELSIREALKRVSELIEEETEKAREEVEEAGSEFRAQAESFRQKIKVLANAKLKNPNIPERAMHIMEGNRRSYVQKAEHFISGLSFPENHELLEEFCADFNARLDEFAKSTVKNYQVLQEFFSEEVRSLFSSIKEMERTAMMLRRMCREHKAFRLRELSEAMKNIDNRKAKEKNLKSQIASKKRELKEKEELAREISEEEQRIRSGEDYKKAVEAEISLEELRRKLRAAKHELRSLFAGVHSCLKKYERIALDHRLLSSYLSDPVEALVKDEKISIASILRKAEEAVKGNKIGLKEKKKKKSLMALEKITKEKLSGLRRDLVSLESRIASLQRKIAESDTFRVLSELEKKREAEERKARELALSIEEDKRTLASLREKKDFAEIEQRLERVAGIRARITG